ncbi:MAG: hypothetical protein OXI81_13655 [Paracoccaceae bacterium]|nr:hypothetical protein [Paracoccaceae bacterium]MDE2915007.1 hypothetical protein [Paracoccaceae bacterium]
MSLINAPAIALVARSDDRWAFAGDRLFVDLDLSKESLPAGTRLSLGSANVRVPAVPHLGCKKFATRYGVEAM